MDAENVLIHWRYFLSLERDVDNMKNYIEVSDANFGAYSMELLKLLQLACSEIDCVLRVLCKEIDPNTDYHDESVYSGNISLYKTTVYNYFPKIHEAKIHINGLSVPLKPWDEWQSNNSPEWWASYNKVKHYRHSNYESANLKNMLMAMSALMVAILYLYRLVKNEPKSHPSPRSVFFDSEYVGPILVCAPNRELPDFE
jgi:hypothetical protein